MSRPDAHGGARAQSAAPGDRRFDARRLKVLACAAAMAFCVQAHAVTFVTSQYDVTAVAGVADAAPGLDAQSSPTLDMPISASTASIGATDVATAGSVGAPGVLTSSADVSAIGGIASATSTSHFLGSFVNTGALTLAIDYTPFSFSSGTGLASTSLFVLLTSNGVTLFQDYLTGSQTFSYAATVGTTGTLDMTLTSDASAGFLRQGGGDASSAAQVSFTSPVPEPGTWALLTAGLGALGLASRLGRRAGAPGE